MQSGNAFMPLAGIEPGNFKSIIKHLSHSATKPQSGNAFMPLAGIEPGNFKSIVKHLSHSATKCKQIKAAVSEICSYLYPPQISAHVLYLRYMVNSWILIGWWLQ